MDEVMTVEQARSRGRSIAGNAARANRRPPAFSRDEMRVTAVNGDRLDLDNGTKEHPMPVAGVPMTTACEGVEVGDVVIVDTYMNRPLVVGVRLRGNGHYVRLRTGTMVVSADDNYVKMWDQREFSEKFGREFDAERDFVGVMNGDGNANKVNVHSSIFDNNVICAQFSEKLSGLIRINYLVALG